MKNFANGKVGGIWASCTTLYNLVRDGYVFDSIEDMNCERISADEYLYKLYNSANPCAIWDDEDMCVN